MCPVSNVSLGVYSDLTSVPLPQLLAAGATVALGADDPLLFGSQLAGQYATMRAAHDLDDATLARLAEMSFEASLAPSDVVDAREARHRRLARMRRLRTAVGRRDGSGDDHGMHRGSDDGGGSDRDALRSFPVGSTEWDAFGPAWLFDGHASTSATSPSRCPGQVHQFVVAPTGRLLAPPPDALLHRRRRA